ncbi:MAG: WD40 repeat domain-containing protein, partial [Stackebrandtia sp.]
MDKTSGNSVSSGAGGPKPAFSVPSAGSSAADVEAVLLDAGWAGFDVDRDLVRLRDSLTALESREGITKAHRLATEKLRERGALLRHPDVHRAELTCHA